MKKFFNTFLVVFIVGWILFFVLTLIGFIFTIIGLSLGIVGFVGIVLYLLIPKKIRAFLEKRKKHEEIKILSTASPIISLIGGILTMFLSSVYINQCCGLRESFGIPFLVIGLLSIAGVVISALGSVINRNLIVVGSLICIGVGIIGFIYNYLGIPLIIVLIGGIISLVAFRKA